MLDVTNPELERARPLYAPRVVPDDIDLAFFCDDGAPLICDDIDLGARPASDCTYAAGDPINLRDPWGLGVQGPEAGPQGVAGGDEEVEHRTATVTVTCKRGQGYCPSERSGGAGDDHDWDAERRQEDYDQGELRKEARRQAESDRRRDQAERERLAAGDDHAQDRQPNGAAWLDVRTDP